MYLLLINTRGKFIRNGSFQNLDSIIGGPRIPSGVSLRMRFASSPSFPNFISDNIQRNVPAAGIPPPLSNMLHINHLDPPSLRTTHHLLGTLHTSARGLHQDNRHPPHDLHRPWAESCLPDHTSRHLKPGLSPSTRVLGIIVQYGDAWNPRGGWDMDHYH